MNPSALFLSLTTQYAQLEVIYNQDFSSTIIQLAEMERDQLIARGLSPADAVTVVNDTLAVLVRRFPVTITA